MKRSKPCQGSVHFIFYKHPHLPRHAQIENVSFFGAHQEFGGRCLKFCFRPKVVYVGFSLDKIYTSPRSCGHTKAVLKKSLNKRSQVSFLMRFQYMFFLTREEEHILEPLQLHGHICRPWSFFTVGNHPLSVFNRSGGRSKGLPTMKKDYLHSHTWLSLAQAAVEP